MSLRTLELTSLVRACGFCKQVCRFYQLLKQIYNEQHSTPERIFNVDETGVTHVQGKQSFQRGSVK